jgi:Tfp pilus assembly protein PilF
MKKTLSGLVLVLTVALALPTLAQEEKLGKVNFPTSCDAKVQPQFQRGLAMLHSYWFIQARKTFESVLQQDPTAQ